MFFGTRCRMSQSTVALSKHICLQHSDLSWWWFITMLVILQQRAHVVIAVNRATAFHIYFIIFYMWIYHYCDYYGKKWDFSDADRSHLSECIVLWRISFCYCISHLFDHLRCILLLVLPQWWGAFCYRVRLLKHMSHYAGMSFWCERVLCLWLFVMVNQDGNVNGCRVLMWRVALFNSQPVEITNRRSNAISRSETCHKSCSRVLDPLNYCYGGLGQAGQNCIAVVGPTQNKCRD